MYIVADDVIDNLIILGYHLHLFTIMHCIYNENITVNAAYITPNQWLCLNVPISNDKGSLSVQVSHTMPFMYIISYVQPTIGDF